MTQTILIVLAAGFQLGDLTTTPLAGSTEAGTGSYRQAVPERPKENCNPVHG